jgi:hypothetical protein
MYIAPGWFNDARKIDRSNAASVAQTTVRPAIVRIIAKSSSARFRTVCF